MDESGDASIILESLRSPGRFADIFERHFDAVYRYAASRVGPTVGGDVAGEVFARAFENRHRFRTDATSARPWLFGIATNLLLNHYRSTARARRAMAKLAGGDPRVETVWFEDIDSLVDAEQARPRVVDALQALRQTDREVLLLSVLAGLSQREVAQALRIPIGTVQSRLFRARAKLRKVLGDIGESTDERSARGNDE